MDSSIVTQLFRQLFRQRPRGCQGHLATATTTALRNGLSQSYRRSIVGAANGRSYATRASIDRGMKKNESRWQQRTHILPEDRSDEFSKYPYISLEELKLRTDRPRRVKLLLRDFIEGECPIIKDVLVERVFVSLTTVLKHRRLPIQPLVRLLFQTGRHLQSWRAL